MHRPLSKVLILALFAITWTGGSWAVRAQNVKIIEQSLDSDRHGYTVMRVWGSHYEMGHGMGTALAQDIQTVWAEMKESLGTSYVLLRWALGDTLWLPTGIEDEIAGIVAGVEEVTGSTDMDALDVKILNTFSDWAYYYGCRSHACWGSRVQEPTRTLSSRRLDYATPFDGALHHVLCAFDPNDGSARWINAAWPGYVTVITAVNQHGTVVSLHDSNSEASLKSGVIARSVALRHILTSVGQMPLEEQLDWSAEELTGLNVATSGFFNVFIPEGLGGVFTCPSGGPCVDLRTPQPDYFDGEVILTANVQTDGHDTPSDAEFLENYYADGHVKTLQDHFEVMGTSGLHLLSVAYRGPDDMSLWFHGRGRSDHLQLEWSQIFYGEGPEPPPQPDIVVGYEAVDVPADIPDADENGIASTIQVAESGTVASLQVQVNISHTYIGDLKVVLEAPSGDQITLHDGAGGSEENLEETYTLATFNGTASAGPWTLLVSDHAEQDTGRIELWALELGIVTSENAPPVADAGADQTVSGGVLVTLDGSESSDPEGQPLEYRWEQLEGPPVELDTKAAQPTFTAPLVEHTSSLIFSLVVNDGQLDSEPDQVTIVVESKSPPELPAPWFRHQSPQRIIRTTARPLWKPFQVFVRN